MIKEISDVEDVPGFGCAVLAMEHENVVIVLGKLVDLNALEYDGKSLGFLAKPGGAAVLASRSMLVKALAELDDYDRRMGVAPVYSDRPFMTVTSEDLEDDAED